MKDVKDTPKLTFGQKLKNLWNYFTTYEKIWYIHSRTCHRVLFRFPGRFR